MNVVHHENKLDQHCMWQLQLSAGEKSLKFGDGGVIVVSKIESISTSETKGGCKRKGPNARRWRKQPNKSLQKHCEGFPWHAIWLFVEKLREMWMKTHEEVSYWLLWEARTLCLWLLQIEAGQGPELCMQQASHLKIRWDLSKQKSRAKYHQIEFNLN